MGWGYFPSYIPNDIPPKSPKQLTPEQELVGGLNGILLLSALTLFLLCFGVILVFVAKSECPSMNEGQELITLTSQQFGNCTSNFVSLVIPVITAVEFLMISCLALVEHRKAIKKYLELSK